MADRLSGLAQPPEQRPLRVVQVLGSSTGGIGRHVRSVATGLLAAGAHVTVLAPADTDTTLGLADTGAEVDHVEIAPLPRPGSDLRSVRRIRASAAGADVVHAHGLRAGALARLALSSPTRGRTPLVVTLHNAVLATGARRRLLAGLERAAIGGADVVLGASWDLVCRARELGAADARLGPVAAAVDGTAPRRDRAAVRDELGVSEDQPLLLAVGRLAPQKDYPTMLAAARSWASRAEPPLLAIVGDGPLLPELRGQVEGRGLPVRLLGPRDDVPDLLAAADVFVMSSTWEARSLAVQEALRAGLPVVATRVGGIPDLVGDAALLTPVGDSAALAAAVSRVLDEPELRDRLFRAAREQVEGWPDEEDTVAQLLAIYDELTRR